MGKLTVEGLVKLLGDIDGNTSIDRISIFPDGSGVIEDTCGGEIVSWDDLDGMFEGLISIIPDNRDPQSILSNKYN